MAVQYGTTSSYYTTPAVNNVLTQWVNRPIPKEPDDMVFLINQTYHLRPDLLAYDLYGSSSLWWVFAQRNPNTLTDPLGSFTSGTTIFLPKLDTLRSTLGF